MAKPRTPNQRNRYAKLRGRLNKYALAVQDIYDTLNKEAAKIAVGTGFAGGGVFRFSDYPMTADAVNRLQGRFVREMRGLIYSGTSAEWKESNLVQDLLASNVLKTYGAQINGAKTKVYYQPNNDALKAFQERTEKGMNLSTKLWNQSGNYKQELEYAISSAVEKGTSAVTLSKRLSKYLNDFPSLKADYREKFGAAVNCSDCEYRSIRLARTEINMAYRTAEQTRWRQMDFVVGYEVKLSGAHPREDICDRAQGRYPKDFVFTGWHPNCMCYVIPILKTEDEFLADDPNVPSVNEVTAPPSGFNQWVQENQERIAQADMRGTLPYFLADNQKYVNAALTAEDAAILQEESLLPFQMCKSVDEYGELISQLPFIGDVSLTDCTLKEAENIARRLYELQQIVPEGAYAFDFETFFAYQAKKGEAMELGTYNHWGKRKMTVAANTTQVMSREVAKQERAALKIAEEQHAKLVETIAVRKVEIAEAIEQDLWTQERIEAAKAQLDMAENVWLPESEAKVKSAKDSFKPKLYSYGRTTASSVTHEFGHYINDMLQTHWDSFPAKVRDALLKIADESGVGISSSSYYKYDCPEYVWRGNDNIFDRYVLSSSRASSCAFDVSTYASTQGAEYFAESFTKFVEEGRVEDGLLNDLFKALFGKV